MPYNFTFRRVTVRDNETALKENIGLATALTDSFAEIVDPNPSGSAFHFTKTVIDANAEFPELHFYLEASIDDFFFQFSLREL